MVAAPSAATGATGLERLLLIFLMKLDESQNATNNTSFSNDQFNDRSVRTSQENSRTQKTSTETCNFTINQRFFHENRTNRKTQIFTEQISRKEQKTSPHRTKIRTNGGKREITEQISNEQRTMVAPAHNHAENYENLQEHTVWMGTGFTRPHGGRLMILPVDQNVGTCLVKLGSTCAPRQPPSFATIHLKNLQKNRAAPLRPIALQRPSQ